jgi:hypothetical protein
MPVDTNLLYGEMIGSGLMHIVAAIGIGTYISMFATLTSGQKTAILIGSMLCLSFLMQFGFLSFLQSASCKGIKDYASIAGASVIGAVITALMICIPIFFEPMRLIVSQLFITHMSQLSPEQARVEEIIERAGVDVAGATSPLQKGGALDYEAYEAQTNRELMFGVAYWAAFAGAYGIGVGSMISTKCKASA